MTAYAEALCRHLAAALEAWRLPLVELLHQDAAYRQQPPAAALPLIDALQAFTHEAQRVFAERVHTTTHNGDFADLPAVDARPAPDLCPAVEQCCRSADDANPTHRHVRAAVVRFPTLAWRLMVQDAVADAEPLRRRARMARAHVALFYGNRTLHDRIMQSL